MTKRLLICILFALAIPLAAQTCPTGITHCTTLTWTWTQATGTDPAVGFHVFRAATCAALSPLPAPLATITGSTNTTYTDATTAAGNQFCYGVTAYNSAGDSPAALSSLLTTPFQVPSVPTGVSGTAK